MPNSEHFTHCSLVPSNRIGATTEHAARAGWAGLIECDLPHPLPDADIFALEEHRVVYDFWRASMSPGAGLPSQEVIRPDAFTPALGNILLLEPEDEGADFRYRIYGSRIAARFGRDMTGKRASDFPRVAAAAIMAQYRHVLDSRWGLYSEHDAPPEVSSIIRWCRLALPFLNDAGAVGRILVANLDVDRA